MRLRAIRIDRLPGIEPGFSLDEVGPGLNLVVGPNASGKSSLCRAIRALLYRDERPGGYVMLTGELDEGGVRWRSERVGSELHWTRDGHDAEPPPLPDHRFLPCYTIELETLLEAGDTEAHLHGLVAREMAGGYDVAAVRATEPFRLKSTHGRSEREALRDAERKLEQVRREHARVRENEARLDGLRAERDAAARAATEAGRARAALALLDARRAADEARNELATYPPEAGMEVLASKGDRFETVERAWAKAREEHAGARRAAQEALARARETGLVEAGIDPDAVEDHKARVLDLREAETRRDRAASELRDARAEARTATERLGGVPEALPDLRPETIARVEEALAGYRESVAALRALERERDRLPDPEAEAPDPDALRRAREALLEWCTAGDGRRGSAQRLAIVLVGLGALAALVGAPMLHPSLWAGGAGLALAFVLLVWGPDPGATRRRSAVERFRSTGLAEPDTWTAPGVGARLTALDRELREAQSRAAGLTRRAEIVREIEHVCAESDAIGHELRDLASRIGFDPRQLDASFAQWLRRVEDLERARRAEATARAAHDAEVAGVESMAREIEAFLAAYGGGTGNEVPDAGALARRLDRIARRLETRDEALREARAAQETARRAARDATEHERERDELYHAAGLEPGDEVALRERLDRLDAWREVRDRRRDAEVKLRLERERLAESPGWIELAEADDEAEIRARLEALEREALRRDAISEDIARIESEIDKAERTRALEAARADRQAAQDRLRDRREEALFAGAGAFLLDAVEAEHAAESRPEVVRRAAEWFATFTRHEFELEVDTRGEGFAARDTRAGVVRRLDQLSSGTRMQLLLAVRLAFALEAERGRASLPIFLDEALTATDPERYRAIADAIAALVESDDRQVFYLSAQPHDELLWRRGRGPAPHVVDMREVRGLAGGRLGAEAFEVAVPPPVPSPPADGDSAAYGAVIGVAPIDPWAPAGAIHVFHLLRDRLDLLHRLLEAGVERAGALRSLLDSAASGAILAGEGEIENLSCRLAIAESFAASWREGRGRPVDRSVLDAAPDVSDRFVDRLGRLARDLGGDARALIEAIRAREREEAKGFRAEKLAAFESWLLENGYLDDRASLDEAGLERRVIEDAMRWIRAGVADAAFVRARVRDLRAGLANAGAVPGTVAVSPDDAARAGEDGR